MKMFLHLWQYIAKLFLEWEMFSRKSKHTFYYIQYIFFRMSCRLWDNVEKYGGARGATNDVTIWRIRVACWISKATYTHAHAQAHALRHTHAHTRAHKRTKRLNSYCFSTITMIRKRVSVLRHTFIVLLNLSYSAQSTKEATCFGYMNPS